MDEDEIEKELSTFGTVRYFQKHLVENHLPDEEQVDGMNRMFVLCTKAILMTDLDGKEPSAEKVYREMKNLLIAYDKLKAIGEDI